MVVLPPITSATRTITVALNAGACVRIRAAERTSSRTVLAIMPPIREVGTPGPPGAQRAHRIDSRGTPCRDVAGGQRHAGNDRHHGRVDRKSTRLNSSHVSESPM